MAEEMATDLGSMTPCPPWCDGVQCQEEDPRDRAHDRDGGSVPVILRKRESGEDNELEPIIVPTAGEVGLTLFTSAYEPDELWVGISLEADGVGFTLTAESARRLMRQFDTFLTSVAM